MDQNEKESILKILQEQYEYAIRKANEWELLSDQTASPKMKAHYSGMADGLHFAIATVEESEQ